MPEGSAIRGLRVLMTVDAVGGVFSYAIHLTRELCRRGAEVTLACMGPEPRVDQYKDAALVRGLRLEHGPFQLEWMDEPWEQVDQAGDWLLKLSRQRGADVVHLNGYCHASLPWGKPTVVVAHSCLVSWWRAVFGGTVPERYQCYCERVASGLDSANAVVAPSASMLKSLREAHGYSGPASVIFNGVPETDYFASPKQPFFLAAGRLWDRAKNLQAVLEASAELPWPVQVVGEGFEGANSFRVHATGRLARAQLARLMGQASVFLHPARYEPFGLAPLEAALSGAALVLGRVDSLREIWGNAACYVSPDDPRELAHAATLLAEDSTLRHAFARRAQARAREFSSAAMAARYAGLYECLLSNDTRSVANASH